jgi:hypothetical protein
MNSILRDTISKKLDVVFVTKLDHLYTLNISIQRLLTYDNVNRIHIVTQRKNFKYFDLYSSERVTFLDEDLLLPSMSFNQLKRLNLPFFPKNAGWYFQQLLKIGVAFENSITENYVVVDADTIFLVKPTFIDDEGHFLFVKADEYHAPYFLNYKRLLKEEPNREFSFISQFMVFNKDLVREMCSQIENNFEGTDRWNWKIMHNITGVDGNLFSEYETYGHFIKNHYPERAKFIELPWLRDGTTALGSIFPSVGQINLLRNKYNYISIELKADSIYGKIKKVFFCKTYPIYILAKTYLSKIEQVNLLNIF